MTSVIKRYHTAFIDVIKSHFYGVLQSNGIVCYYCSVHHTNEINHV